VICGKTVDNTVEVRLPYSRSLIAAKLHAILEQHFVFHLASIPRKSKGPCWSVRDSTFQNQRHHDLAMLECKMPGHCPAAPIQMTLEACGTSSMARCNGASPRTSVPSCVPSKGKPCRLPSTPLGSHQVGKRRKCPVLIRKAVALCFMTQTLRSGCYLASNFGFFLFRELL